jgi:hypothetical protein
VPLALSVVLLVVAVTAVAGAAGYLIDLSVRRAERRRDAAEEGR